MDLFQSAKFIMQLVNIKRSMGEMNLQNHSLTNYFGETSQDTGVEDMASKYLAHMAFMIERTTIGKLTPKLSKDGKKEIQACLLLIL